MKKYFQLGILMSLLLTSCGQKKDPVMNTPPDNSAKMVIDDTVGIGILEVSLESNIPLYLSDTAQSPFDIIHIRRTKAGDLSFTTNHLKQSFRPYQLSGGDTYKGGERHRQMGLVHFPPVLKFRVLQVTDSTFQVIVDEEKRTSAFIRIGKEYKLYASYRASWDDNTSSRSRDWCIYETWEEYLKRVEFIIVPNLKIYDKPGGQLIFSNDENTFLPFNVAEVKGEWIKLEKGFGREFNFDEKKNYDGWVRWTDGKNVLIRITEMTYE